MQPNAKHIGAHLTPERWAEIEALFHRAVECQPEQLSRLLDEGCHGDPELRREVVSLLSIRGSEQLIRAAVGIEMAWAGMSGQRSETNAGDPGAGNLLATRTIAAGETVTGTVIGLYRLLQPIGQGGMGEVWLAEQKEPIRRRVAIKLIKTGMDTREVVARFESERQALALMDHPAIAKVFDAGSTPQGRPYFVMEYVTGIPIVEYCDKHKMTPRERLELFIHVCQGVQHAHQKAIIHRDLKPSNILVGEVDGKPMPRIIDFGVAKATSQRLTADSMFTRVGAIMGTPGYMSPEQADSSGQDIDTRTDVYSLGVVLYELMVGALPLDFRNLTFDEVLRRLREKEAPRPSTRLRALGEHSSITAQNRGTDTAKLVRQLRGDVDLITLKALEKDRSRRYMSPTDLAADIQRHLNDEPILARPKSASYQLQKFARRHKALVAGVAAVFAVLIAGVIVSTREATRARRAEQVANTERNRAVGEKKRADAESATAKAVNEFLQNDLLAQASANVQAQPDTKPDPDLKVRTVLDRAAARIPGKFDRQPLVEASIRQTIGNAYRDLGLYPEAQRHMERALDLRQRFLGEDHPDTLETMNDVAELYLEYQGKSGQAEPLLNKVLEVRRRVLGEEHLDTLTSASNLAAFYRDQGKYAPAEPLLTKVLEVRRRVLGEEHPSTLDSMDDLARLYRYQGKYAQAEPLYTQVLEMRRRVLGELHPDTLSSTNNLALLYQDQGKYEKAEPLLTSVVKTWRGVLGEEHPVTLTGIGNLGRLYQNEGKYAQAEPLLIKVLEVRRRVLGESHPDTLISMNNLAAVYRDEGKYAQAEPLFSNVVEAWRRVLGEEHPNTLIGMSNLALAYLNERKYAQAESVLHEALKIYQKTKANTWGRGNCESMLGASLAGEKKYAEAEPLLLSGYEVMLEQKASMPASRPDRLERAGNWIVHLYQDWGKPAKVAEWRKKLSESKPAGR